MTVLACVRCWLWANIEKIYSLLSEDNWLNFSTLKWLAKHAKCYPWWNSLLLYSTTLEIRKCTNVTHNHIQLFWAEIWRSKHGLNHKFVLILVSWVRIKGLEHHWGRRGRGGGERERRGEKKEGERKKFMERGYMLVEVYTVSHTL